MWVQEQHKVVEDLGLKEDGALGILGEERTQTLFTAEFSSYLQGNTQLQLGAGGEPEGTAL